MAACLLVSIAIVWCTVCVLGLNVSASGRQGKQIDLLPLYNLFGVPSVFWGLMTM